MANFYGKDRENDFASSKLMSFGKSFSRMNGQPLDESEVWYNKAELEAFAAGNSAYVGMDLVYVDEANQKVYKYAVQYDGTVKEIGVTPLGDNKSIVVDPETATISLKGIGSLVFERDILDEEDQPTGETESVQYQPLMTAAGLVWVEPSKTTVEGLATLIDALTLRVKSLEDKVGVASNDEGEATGLYKLISNEAEIRDGAVQNINGRIDDIVEAIGEIDFVDDNELAETLEPYAKTADINTTLEAYAKTADVNTELAKKADITYVNDEIDKIEEAISNLNHFKAEIVESIDAVTEVGILYLIKDSTVTGEDKYNEYIVVDGVATLIGDTTTDLSNYYNKTEIDGIRETINNTIDDEIAAREALAEKVTALENVDNATQEELNAYKEEVSDALDLKADASTLEDYLKSEDASSTYATKEYVGDIPAAYTETSVISYIDKKAEESVSAVQGNTTETVASLKQQLDDYKTENNTKVTDNTNAISTINEKLDDIEEGAQVNVIEAVEVATEAKITATKAGKTVTIDDSALVALISAAQSKADTGVANAATAQAKADTNESNINTLSGRVTTVEGKVNDNASAIAEHATEFATLQGTVGGIVDTLTTKADKSVVDGINTTVAGHITELADLTSRMLSAEGTITNLSNNKADKSDVYTKTEIGTIAEGKTLVQMISDAQTAATYDDTQVKSDISDNAANIKKNTDAIAKLNADDKTEGSVDYKVAQEVAKIVNDNNDGSINTLNEIAAWIVSDTTGAAKMNSDIAANTAAVTKLTGDVNTEGSVLYMIAENAPETASVNEAGLVKSVATTVENGVSVASDGTMSVNSINVNRIVQTENEFLVLNGGSANV